MAAQYGSAEVLEELRQRIGTGDLPPGALLPTYAELCRRYGVSRATLHRAIDRLKRDGLIRTAGRAGMRVVGRPPCRHRYALVLTAPDGRDNRFLAALAEAAGGLAAQRGDDIAILQGQQLQPGDPLLPTLAAEAAARRLAGLVVAGDPRGLLQALGREAGSLPVVGLSPAAAQAEVGWLVPDHAAVAALACAWAAARGRRRMAAIGPPGHPAMAALPDAAARCGLRADPCWRLEVDLRSPGAARAIAHLLMRAAPRPDAVLLPDDNIAVHALAGLADAGIAIGAEVDVAAHANLPLPGPAPRGVRLVGFDVPGLLAAALGAIDARRRGGPAAGSLVPPRLLDP